MQRYSSSSSEEILISKEDIHHIENVMRGKTRDLFEIVFNEKIYLAEIIATKPLKFTIKEELVQNNELNNKITLFYALSKGDKNEFVMQKATELGVDKIVLISSNRCVNKMSNDDFNKKKTRYERIIKEAAEQSKRNKLPEIIGIYNIKNIPSDLLCDHNFVAYECESGNTNKTINYFQNIKEKDTVSILIGSEGGLEEKEVENLLSIGFSKISLGKRILRTETAAIYALSTLTFVLEGGNNNE